MRVETKMSEREGMRSCFKYGCFGCLSLVAVAFGLLFLLSAIQMSNGSEPTFEEKQTEQSLPPLPPLPPPAPNAPPAPPLGGGQLPAEDPGLSAEPNEVRQVELPGLGGPLGTVEVDFDMGAFHRPKP